MGLPNVFRLRALVSTTKEDDDCASTLIKVHPISRTVVYPQFRYTVANRLCIPRVSQ